MKYIKRLVVVSISLLLAFAAFSFYVTEQIMRPGFYEHRTPEQGLKPIEGLVDPKVSFGYSFESVEFPAQDGQSLRGWIVPTESDSKTIIIAVHGGGSDRRSYLSFVPVLNKAGYPVLLFDNREHGISDGVGLGMSLGLRESEDVVSAVDFLSERGYEQFAVLGNSQGATSAIVAAARDRRLSCVVAQGTGTDLEDMMQASPLLGALPRWSLKLIGMHYYFRQGADWSTIRAVGVWPIDVVEQIAPRPIFFIHGENDARAPLELAEQNYAAAGLPKSLWVVKGGEHRGLREFAGEEFDRKVVSFLDSCLNAPAQ
jgi:dipeptidyl aminopeptidase/acylaminoacyl peptidase